MIEMLVALAINVILLAALIDLVATNLSHYTKTMEADILNQQLEAAMQIMSNDIRRAGYWSNARNDLNTGQNNNPFMASGVDIATGASNTCILFAYDYNNNGSLPSVASGSDDERYGFRLSGNNLQFRPPGATFACNAASGNWENVTDPNIVKITGLTFQITSTSTPVWKTSNTILVRSVDITLTGQLVDDSSVTKTLTQHVRIRNDKFVP